MEEKGVKFMTSLSEEITSGLTEPLTSEGYTSVLTSEDMKKIQREINDVGFEKCSLDC